MWPLNSSDLNPMDYAIWSVIQLDAAGNILRVHYKSMKCDVSFSLGSVSALFRWGGHFCHVCVKHFFLLTTVQKLFLKIHQDFPELWSQLCTATFLWFTVYMLAEYKELKNFIPITKFMLKSNGDQSLANGVSAEQMSLHSREWSEARCDCD